MGVKGEGWRRLLIRGYLILIGYWISWFIYVNAIDVPIPDIFLGTIIGWYFFVKIIAWTVRGSRKDKDNVLSDSERERLWDEKSDDEKKEVIEDMNRHMKVIFDDLEKQIERGDVHEKKRKK